MPVIVVANQKGGVGKTTTAVTIAHGLALNGYGTLLVDLDPQGQCATMLGMEQESGIYDLFIKESTLASVFRETGRSGLWLIPGDKKTATAATMLGIMNPPISTLRDLLKPALKNLDYVVIDTAPSVSNLQAQGLWSSNYLLIPTACDFASSQGVVQLVNTMVGLAKEYSWEGKLVGILPTFYDTQTNETKTSLNELQNAYEGKVLNPIHRATILRECMAEGKTIFELNKESRAAIEYSDLVKHIEQVTK